jgi:hypothetical protein
MRLGNLAGLCGLHNNRKGCLLVVEFVYLDRARQREVERSISARPVVPRNRKGKKVMSRESKAARRARRSAAQRATVISGGGWLID